MYHCHNGLRLHTATHGPRPEEVMADSSFETNGGEVLENNFENHDNTRYIQDLLLINRIVDRTAHIYSSPDSSELSMKSSKSSIIGFVSASKGEY